MGSLQKKNLLDSDERRESPLADLHLARAGSISIGRGVLEPGWRWSTHMRPIMGTASCPIHHVQVVLSGRFAIRMDDGEEIELGPNDVADIPPGHDAWVVGDEPAVVLDVGGNITGIAVPQEHERILATILLTDIVGSTAIAERSGDQAWKQLLGEHDRVIRVQLGRFRGTEIKTVGDGFVTTFASPVAALRCGRAICADVRPLGLEVRVGVHTGEDRAHLVGHRGDRRPRRGPDPFARGSFGGAPFVGHEILDRWVGPRVRGTRPACRQGA